MKRLDLNFAPRSARYWWARASLALRVALFGAVLGLIAVLALLRAVHVDRQQLQEALSRAASTPAPAEKARAALANKETQLQDVAQVKAMNQAVLALNRPWAAVWDALERVSGAPGVQVAILEMRPDTNTSAPDSGVPPGMRLLAESKDSAHMLGFMRQLRAEPFFVSAVLNSHTVNAQDPNKPLRFEVQLQWTQASL